MSSKALGLCNSESFYFLDIILVNWIIRRIIFCCKILIMSVDDILKLEESEINKNIFTKVKEDI